MAKDVKIQAAKYLEAHALVEKVYSTGDGFLFERKQHAIQHAQTLEDKHVATHVRVVGDEAPTVTVTTETAANTDDKTTDAKTVEAPEKEAAKASAADETNTGDTAKTTDSAKKTTSKSTTAKKSKPTKKQV